MPYTQTHLPRIPKVVPPVGPTEGPPIGFGVRETALSVAGGVVLEQYYDILQAEQDPVFTMYTCSA